MVCDKAGERKLAMIRRREIRVVAIRSIRRYLIFVKGKEVRERTEIGRRKKAFPGCTKKSEI